MHHVMSDLVMSLIHMMHRLARHEYFFIHSATHIVWQVSGGLSFVEPFDCSRPICHDGKPSISCLIHLLMPVGLEGAVRSTLNDMMVADDAINDTMMIDG